MDKRNLAIDALALAVYLVVANPAITGIGLHEWLGIGLLGVFFVHALVHADWVGGALRVASCRPSAALVGNLALDALLVVAFMTVTVSGLGMSGAVLPTFGIYAEGYYFWNPLHASAAKVLLASLLVHLVVHGTWIARAIRKAGGHER